METKENTIIAAILKDIIVNIFRIEGNLDEIEIIKGKTINLVNYFIEELKKNSLTYDNIWIKYHYFFEETRELYLLPYEKEEYKENRVFSEKITMFCVNILIEELNHIDQQSLLPYGVVNEISRVYTTHGSKVDQLILKILVTYYGRYLEYIKYILGYSDKIINNIENKFNYIKNELKNVLSLYIEKGSLNRYESSELLYEICSEWRKMFIRYMDIVPFFSKRREEKIDLPDEAKDKIKKMVEEITFKELSKSE
ncbi:MAG: hypothetical protein ACTSVY_16010 [Candidatus Helarchaeota archaeon]